LEKKGIPFPFSTAIPKFHAYLYQEYGRQWCANCAECSRSLWDEEAKRAMFLARDPWASSLYYADDGACLRVASQVKALRSGDHADSRPNPLDMWASSSGGMRRNRGLCTRESAPAAGSTLLVQQDSRVDEPEKYFDLATELAEIEASGKSVTTAESRERFAAAPKESWSHCICWLMYR
jgi:asparagine synthase (glutamine-hydrolysing)